MNEKELLQKKQQIENAKSESAELKGKAKYLSEELKTKWGCNTIEEAQNKKAELLQEINDITEQINIGVKKIEDDYQI